MEEAAAMSILPAFAAIFVVIMIGAFTLSGWAYILLVVVCFCALRLGRYIEGRSNDQNPRDGVP